MNSKKVPVQSGIQHLDSTLKNAKGSKSYAKIDLLHGFSQLTLSKKTQEIMSVQTAIEIFSPYRLLQGGAESGLYFHDRTRETFLGKLDKILQWLNNFLLYANDENELLENLETFFEICSEDRLRINIKKSCFYVTKARFCGRLLSKEGIKYNPRNMQALLDMKPPKKADQLQQFIWAVNWMRNSIPEYSKTIAPLQKLMENAIKTAGKRTKRALSKIDIFGEWTTNHEDAFKNIKEKVANATSLAYPKKNFAMCLFTDASDHFWSAILSQTPENSMEEPICERIYEPVAFLSGTFKNSSLNWSVPEKEG